ncbi:EamA-like transporter [Ferriphaselus amnicola]|uniref:EamA-like transporter n=1 Tax=Ferriphaselus amnicola TaxID=1188319 RepID=A0A2Z6GCP9_9PROT|nr:DMT family transporter [Ferriphaselus amnicola]BBE51230.1 EamA-like transporter [Ferriphaselus amnicola]
MSSSITATFPQGRAVSALLAGSVLWGLFWWPLKAFEMAGIHVSFVQIFAYGSATLVLLPFAWRSLPQWRSQFGLLLLICLLGGWANASFATALAEGNVVRVLLLFYLAPVWTILAARVFLAEPFTPLRLGALALALVGLVSTLGGAALFATPLSLIDLLALSSGLAFALNNIAIRVGHKLPELTRAAAVFMGCAVISLGWGLWSGRSLPALESMHILALLGLGLLWVIPGTLATFYGVARLDAGKAAILLLAELVVGVFSAVLIGNEHLSMQEIIGGALILSAALIEAVTEQRGDQA